MGHKDVESWADEEGDECETRSAGFLESKRAPRGKADKWTKSQKEFQVPRIGRSPDHEMVGFNSSRQEMREKKKRKEKSRLLDYLCICCARPRMILSQTGLYQGVSVGLPKVQSSKRLSGSNGGWAAGQEVSPGTTNMEST